MMRFVPVLFVIMSGLCATSSSAQEWRAYISLEDGFRARVPGEFAVTETTWDSEYGAANCWTSSRTATGTAPPW